MDFNYTEIFGDIFEVIFTVKLEGSVIFKSEKNNSGPAVQIFWARYFSLF